MKKLNLVFVLALVALMALSSGVAMAAEAAATGNELMIADFDTGDKPNNIGGDFGGWDKDPNDESQGTQMSFDTDDAKGTAGGYSIRLDYDVDSPNPAYNGFWMKLNGEDATPYNTLNLYVKGDAKVGYTKRFKIELKDMTNKPSAYIVSGVTDQWQKISIPFEKFRRIENWNSLNEIVVVFDDINSSPKTGAILIDDISLSKE
ncbi:MAG TPA: CIA30 family protein [Candidatus Omnitrophota bacterium]|nr:CIA30 family protein [Candidatus Omnitrophota bacterium]HPS36712.1 CIA30 family protein [Candidatus Omnitrophota bacterium]